MTSALSPREIQSRLRAGASIAEVATDAGVEVDRIEGFALPVMAERAHVTRTALGATVRRRGDAAGHRRLGDLIQERLQARGLDADTVDWDSWRQGDLRWRLVGLLDDQAASRAAEFIYDTKGRFSVADNADARWMIGEELPGVADDPDNENTIDFHDEFALVRATADGSSTASQPGDDVPPIDSSFEGSAHTSELDELYDMLSGVSEDSVRIYLGLEDGDDEDSDERVPDDVGGSSSDTRSTDEGVRGSQPSPDTTDDRSEGTQKDDAASRWDFVARSSGTSTQASEDQPETRLAEELSEHPDLPSRRDGGVEDDHGVATGETAQDSSGHDAGTEGQKGTVETDPSVDGLEQAPLIPGGPPPTPKRKPARKRASIPSWDEIMFGGPSRT